MSTSTDVARPLPALDLVAPHLERLEGLLILRGRALSEASAAGQLDGVDRRIRVHLRGLRTQEAEAVRIATLRLHRPFPYEACAAAVALLHLAPKVVLDAKGALRLRAEVAKLLFKVYPLGAHQKLPGPTSTVPEAAPGSGVVARNAHHAPAGRNASPKTCALPVMDAPSLLALPFHEAANQTQPSPSANRMAESAREGAATSTPAPSANAARRTDSRPASQQTCVLLAIPDAPALPFRQEDPQKVSLSVTDSVTQASGAPAVESVTTFARRVFAAVDNAEVAPSVQSPPTRVRVAPKPLAQTSSFVAVPKVDALPFAASTFRKPPSNAPAPTPQATTPPSSAPASAPPQSTTRATAPLTLLQHASLCAELALAPHHEADILRRYGVTSATKAALDNYYRRLLATDPALAAAWHDGYRRYADWLARGARAGGK